MKQPNAIIGLLAQTSIHAGSGQNTGVIDLSIQREGHNGWPCIFGSAVKGAVRTCAEDQSHDKDNIALIFGSEPNASDVHAGSVSFSDARILLFPVRSLTSQFKWVTCPAALRRYKKDQVRLGLDDGSEIPELEFPVSTSEELAYVIQTQNETALYLEEYRFVTEQQDLSQVKDMLSKLMAGADSQSLESQLVVVSDDMFSFLVQHATPVNAHIAIESETKTVKSGALWYEETLPPETLLYFTLSAANARQYNNTKKADEICNAVIQLFDERAWLQLGGNETVGMGWCEVKFLSK